MYLIDREKVIPKMVGAKFNNAEDVASAMFNAGLDKAIDILLSEDIVDAKLKLSSKEYQRDYYQRVTKIKRQEKRRNKDEGNNPN